jgi:hypothetical protein
MQVDMKCFASLLGLSLLLSCQTESLDIRSTYRIRLNATTPGASLKLRQSYLLPVELLTDSYYAKYGYQLEFYQAEGLGRLVRPREGETAVPVLQHVPTNLPLGRSDWQYIPEAAGVSQIVLIARQERGYTQPDTVRLTFQIVP